MGTNPPPLLLFLGPFAAKAAPLLQPLWPVGAGDL